MMKASFTVTITYGKRKNTRVDVSSRAVNIKDLVFRGGGSTTDRELEFAFKEHIELILRSIEWG